ncbi:MAG: ABC transporter substrate-binding protein [Bacilli bacterium]|nr:ABC transporter substrate-binding protein [Acholeplasmataceae bacterium]
MKKYLLLLILLLSMIGITGCKDDDLIKIHLAEVAHSVFYAPQYVALNKGFFEEEGLKVEITNVNGADKVMAALLSGDVQIGLCGPEASIYVYNNGQEDYMVNFIQLTQRDGSFIVGREQIENFDVTMLKNKSILGGRKGGVPEMTLEYVIKQAGLTLAHNSFENDVNVRIDVQFGAMAGAFISGEGDFTTLFEPTATQIERQGHGYVLAAVGALSGEIPFTAYSCNKSYLEKNHEILEKFTRAIYKGQKYVQENSNRDVAIAMQPSFVDASLDDLIMVVARYRSIDAWCHTPSFKEEGLNRLMDIMELAGELTVRAPFEKIVDNSLAERIIDELN